MPLEPSEWFLHRVYVYGTRGGDAESSGLVISVWRTRTGPEHPQGYGTYIPPSVASVVP